MQATPQSWTDVLIPRMPLACKVSTSPTSSPVQVAGTGNVVFSMTCTGRLLTVLAPILKSADAIGPQV